MRGHLTSARPVNGRHRCASGLDGAVEVTNAPCSTNRGRSDALSYRPRAELTAATPRTRLGRRATGVALARPVRGDLTSARPVNGRHRCASGLDAEVVVPQPPWSTNGGRSDALSHRPRAEQTAGASHAALATSYRSCVATTGQRRSEVSPACEWSAQVCYRAGWCSSSD